MVSKPVGRPGDVRYRAPLVPFAGSPEMRWQVVKPLLTGNTGNVILCRGTEWRSPLTGRPGERDRVGQRIIERAPEPDVLPRPAEHEPEPERRTGVRPDGPQPPQPPAGRPWWRRLPGPQALTLLAFTVLAVALFGNTWKDPTTVALGGGGGDGSIFIWFLEWTAYAITHRIDPFITDHMGYPEGVSVLWNTSLVGPGALLAPLTLAFGPVLTFNLVNMAAHALSAWCAYLAVRRYVPSHLGAAVAGLVYGFSPAMYAQAHGHVHMTLMFIPPLMLLAVDQILVRAGSKRRTLVAGVLLGVLAAAQLVTGEEVLAFAGVCGAVLALVLVVLFPRRTVRRLAHVAIGFPVALAVFGVLAAWPLRAQLFGRQVVEGDIRPGSRFVSDLLGFIVPTHYQLLSPDSTTEIALRFTGNSAEWNAYVGIPLILLVLFTGIRWWRVAAVRVAFVCALLIALLSMGSHMHVGGRVTGVALPWSVVGEIPLLESALAGRLMLFAWLAIGLLLAFFLWRMARSGWPGKAVAAVVLVAVLVPLIPKDHLDDSPTNTPRFFTSPAVERIPEGSSALIVPYPVPPRAIAMVWQAEADMRFKMPGGYYIVPDEAGRPRFGPAASAMNGLLTQARNAAVITRLGAPVRERLAGELDAWDIRTIVVGPVGGPPGGQVRVLTFLTTLMGRPPERVEDVQVWWNVDPAAVAALQDPPLGGTKAAREAARKAKGKQPRKARKK
jgi:hypothetical protein